MKREIVGFHQDEEGDWVAELACGHRRHVRHNPPWMRRPWVTTKKGRKRYIGRRIECGRCGTEASHAEESKGGKDA